MTLCRKFVPVRNQASRADRIPHVLRHSRKSRGWRVDRHLSWTQIAVYGVTGGMRREQTIIVQRGDVLSLLVDTRGMRAYVAHSGVTME